jgi:hypothetical protein
MKVDTGNGKGGQQGLLDQEAARLNKELYQGRVRLT